MATVDCHRTVKLTLVTDRAGQRTRGFYTLMEEITGSEKEEKKAMSL